MAEKGIEIKMEIQKFNRDLNAYVEKLAKNTIPDFLRQFGFAFLEEVIPLTPVDTGRARAGWYPALQALGGAASGNRSEGDYKESFSGKLQFIVISNRVHYIVYLEYGHSKQAPGGMVRITLNKIAALLRSKRYLD